MPNGRSSSCAHLQIYVADPAGQRAVAALGVVGRATAPDSGDYLMPVGVNTAANKLDAFLRRTVRWRVRLSPDGAAQATAGLTLPDDGPAFGLPRYIIGPFDSEFRQGQNQQIATLYVAGGYGFTRATLDGRPVEAKAQADFGGLALTQEVGIQARSTITLGYQLTRPAAAERLGDNRLRYRLLLRPQATVHPDRARIAVQASPGWRSIALPPDAHPDGATAAWSGAFDRERELVFDLADSAATSSGWPTISE